MDILIPERFREAHWTGYKRAMTTGHTRYAQQVLLTRSATKGGKTVYLDMTFSILQDDTGQVLGALAIARDVTERRTEERALRERLAELERQMKLRGENDPGEACL